MNKVKKNNEIIYTAIIIFTTILLALLLFVYTESPRWIQYPLFFIIWVAFLYEVFCFVKKLYYRKK